MTTDEMQPISISKQAIKRMPYYFQALLSIRESGTKVVAAPAIAAMLGLNEVQVRKDLAAMSTTKGKPRAGFIVQELTENMENFMGYNNTNEAVLVGAGSLGRALLSHQEFENYGMHIVAAFDADDSVVGTEVAGRKILPMDKLYSLCRRLNIHIGIITVPAAAAQSVCDQLVASGILAIWNFASVRLITPKDIRVQSENMAASLVVLSKHLEENLKK